MEGNFQGDLADIFRPGNVGSGDPPGVSVSDWQYFDQSDQETQMIQKSTRSHDQGFGQPFTSLLADPLIIDHEGTSLFGTTSLNENLEQQQSTRTQLGFDDHNNNNQSHNIFSNMLQISSSSNAAKTSSNNEIITSCSSSKRSLLEASTTSLQISSPRNPAIKRR
ncbi:hypothetical protein L1987_59199 [Smallanthus sonchifolius]|uniref:Uncharacterized protein n=1 Tax=Smallanthus sonchifolius TaxID=185202 RepID=A0ACB9D4S9_9ASTR|nr:hypothetical protein L1987_59199 [Smallanthus sonchifolius]